MGGSEAIPVLSGQQSHRQTIQASLHSQRSCGTARRFRCSICVQLLLAQTTRDLPSVSAQRHFPSTSTRAGIAGLILAVIIDGSIPSGSTWSASTTGTGTSTRPPCQRVDHSERPEIKLVKSYQWFKGDTHPAGRNKRNFYSNISCLSTFRRSAELVSLGTISRSRPPGEIYVYSYLVSVA